MKTRPTAPTSCPLSVVCGPRPSSRGWPKWRDSWKHFFVWPSTDRSQLDGDSFLYDQILIDSPSFTRLLILLQLASGNVCSKPGPAPVHPTNPKYPCSVCSREVGRTSNQCSRCKRWVHSTCSGLPGPTLSPRFPGVAWVVGSAHPVQQTHPTTLQPL